MKRPLHPATAFIRSLKRMGRKNRDAVSAIQATLLLLEEDAFDPRLGTHKLKGDLSELWACSAGYNLRIVFELSTLNNEAIILLVSVGTHDEVY